MGEKFFEKYLPNSVSGIKQYRPQKQLHTYAAALVIVLISLIMKLPIEYHLHIRLLEPFQTRMDTYLNRYLW